MLIFNTFRLFKVAFIKTKNDKINYIADKYRNKE